MIATPLKLGAYGVALAAAFGAAWALGGATGPLTKAPVASSHTETTMPAGEAVGHGDAHAASADAALPGLAVSSRGYTLRPATEVTRAGTAVPYTFRITGPDGHPVTDFTRKHEKDLHLIVVRRDLGTFQHVHPVRDAAGTWSVPLDLSRPGTYRVFADSAPSALGESVTLGTDLAVAGSFTPAPLPAAARVSTVDGYTVRLTGSPVAGREAELTFTVERGGLPVTGLQPYLGASGHLVSLRAGDLAYLHTHAVDHDGLRFATTFPTAGTYRLFLDFKHGGRVRTAAFTVTVGDHS